MKLVPTVLNVFHLCRKSLSTLVPTVLRGNEVRAAPRPLRVRPRHPKVRAGAGLGSRIPGPDSATRSVEDGITTQSVVTSA